MQVDGGRVLWRYEVRTCARPRWCRFCSDLWDEGDAPAPPPMSAQVEEIDPYYGDAVELATRELDDALPEIVGAGAALDIQAVRIALWVTPEDAAEDATCGGCPDREPDVVLTAGTAQLVAARLEWDAHLVARAQAVLDGARARLRRRILTTDRARPRPLGRNEIARAAADGLSRRPVLAFLAGRDLIDAAFAALPAHWPRDRSADSGAVADLTGFFGPAEPIRYRCGPAMFDLDAGGTVRLRVDAAGGGPDPGDRAVAALLADEERFAEHQRHLASRQHQAADEVLTALLEHDLIVECDSVPATSLDLASHSCTLARAPRASAPPARAGGPGDR